ncbi:MAG TPA: hypothetical protein VJT09_17950 [Pyrinomonadaceae bacterium]|nr:hypothetical protein [Pyrinomonadaceae bacterium]
MKIYLLNLDGGRCAFYSEGPEVDALSETTSPREGLRGWAERKYKSLQSVLTESEQGVGLRVRRVWEWLQKRIPPDEPVLRSLRGARSIDLHHPPTLGAEETRTIWHGYLKNRQGKHTFWFVINALVSPLTVLLAPLPGPNVIGYWFVYRAVCHLLARLGARNARGEQVETAFLSTGALDCSVGAADEERIAGLSSSFGLSGLDAFVKRLAAKKAGSRRKAPITVS